MKWIGAILLLVISLFLVSRLLDKPQLPADQSFPSLAALVKHGNAVKNPGSAAGQL